MEKVRFSKQYDFALEDIKNAIEGGSGSNVEWEQTVTGGTKIAAITINDNTTDVYAPEAGGVKGYDIETELAEARAALAANNMIDGFWKFTFYHKFLPGIAHFTAYTIVVFTAGEMDMTGGYGNWIYKFHAYHGNYHITATFGAQSGDTVTYDYEELTVDTE